MKTLKLFPTIVLIFFSNLLFAQITFQKAYTDSTYGNLMSIKQTSDGGFVTLYSGGSLDIGLIKMDQYGDISWNKTYGGAGEDVGFDVRQTTDGGYIVCGYSKFGVNHYIYVIKTNAVGDLVWSKTYGGKGSAHQIQQTNDGGYIIGAIVDSNIIISNWDLGLIKIDSIGNLQWSKRYFNPYQESDPSLTQTNDGGYILGARSFTYGVGPGDGYMIKTNSVGDFIWEKRFVTPDLKDYISSIAQTNDSNIIFACGMHFGKMTENGITLWTKQFAYNGNSIANIFGIRPISNGGYLVFGNYQDTITLLLSDYFFSKIDLNGNPLWTRSIQNCKYIYSADQAADGGYFFCSSTEIGFQNKGYMIKTDANGYAPCDVVNEIVNVSAVNLTEGNFTPVVSNNMSETVVNTTVGNPNIVISNPCALTINEQVTESPTSFFPNPFTTTLTINQTSSLGELTLIDISGKEILRQKTTEGNTKINTSFLTPGFYILHYNEKNKTANFKITKY